MISENIKNKSNNELVEIQKKLADEFEKVRTDLIKMYDYWASIEKIYNEVNVELNNRFGVNNE
jgi:predicted methyltransferase